MKIIIAGIAGAALLVLGGGISSVSATAAPAPRAVHASLELVTAPQHPAFADCFGPHPHARTGSLCWEGAICLNTSIHQTHPEFKWCLSRVIRHGIRLVTINDLRRKAVSNWAVRLAGFVTDVGVHHWPFKNPHLDRIFDGYAVVNIHVAFRGNEQRFECIGTFTGSYPAPVNTTSSHGGGCSREGQFRLNKHGTFMVWKPGSNNEIIVVNFTNSLPHADVPVLLTVPAFNAPPQQNEVLWNIEVNPSLKEFQRFYRVALTR